MNKCDLRYYDIITVENLLQAWREFLRGKNGRQDVAVFELNLMDNILDLYNDLVSLRYQHGPYQSFNISDPKPRVIHKAAVKDRLLHHLIYQSLCDFFDRKFIYDSYSCRLEKGTHRAIYRFTQMARRVSNNNTKTCYVLKGDIKKFFANIDHRILKNILIKQIEDKNILWLLGQVIDSFNTAGKTQIGLPLGNLTSQLLVNVYMNEFDQFVKRVLKAKYYLRYADDFIVLSSDKKYLEGMIVSISYFLNTRLKLQLHADKILVKTMAAGVDWLGWVNFPQHRVLRTKTKRRMMERIVSHPTAETSASYLGLLQHGNVYKLEQKISNSYNNLS